MRIFIKNNKGVPSASLTFSVIAFTVVTISYILSCFTQIGPLQIRPFDNAVVASYLTPVLALYFGRKVTDSKSTSGENK